MLDGFFFKKHLEEDEHIRLIVHKHWVLGVRFLLLPSVSFLLSQTVLAVRHSRGAVIVCALWSIASLVWWLRNFLDYYLDAWIITDHGIIDLEWLGWFHRQSARILYSDVQGVSTEIHGILGTVLRYGTISVEKISTGAAVSLSEVPRPRRVESVILKNMEEYLHSKNLKNAKHIEELLSKFVAEHINEDDLAKGKKKSGMDTVVDTPRDTQPRSARPTKTSFSSSRIGSPKS